MSIPPTLDYEGATEKPSPLLAILAFAFGCAACAYSIYGWINIESFTMSVIYITVALSGAGAILGVIGRVFTRRPTAFVGLLLSIIACGIATAEYTFILFLAGHMGHG